MAKMKKSFTKVKRYRGGYQVARPSRNRVMTGIMSTLPSVIDTITPAIKSYVSDQVADQQLDSVARVVGKVAEKVKTPRGKRGRNLNKNKAELVDTQAVSATTESTSCFIYNPRRKSLPGVIRETNFRNKKWNVTTTSGQQDILDVPLWLLEPPANDSLSNANGYTILSARDQFDRAVRARMVTVTTAKDQVEQNLILKFGQLTSMLTINCGTKGGIVEIYDLQPKFGIGPGTFTEGATIPTTDHISPYWCFSNGFTGSASIESLDNAEYYTVNADPMVSTTFRRTWNVIKKTTVRMTSNSVHRHRFVADINKSVTWDEMGQASPNGGTAPWLPAQMLIFKGYPTAASLADAEEFVVQNTTTVKYSHILGGGTNVINYNSTT